MKSERIVQNYKHCI